MAPATRTLPLLLLLLLVVPTRAILHVQPEATTVHLDNIALDMGSAMPPALAPFPRLSAAHLRPLPLILAVDDLVSAGPNATLILSYVQPEPPRYDPLPCAPGRLNDTICAALLPGAVWHRSLLTDNRVAQRCPVDAARLLRRNVVEVALCATPTTLLGWCASLDEVACPVPPPTTTTTTTSATTTTALPTPPSDFTPCENVTLLQPGTTVCVFSPVQGLLRAQVNASARFRHARLSLVAYSDNAPALLPPDAARISGAFNNASLPSIPTAWIELHLWLPHTQTVRWDPSNSSSSSTNASSPAPLPSLILNNFYQRCGGCYAVVNMTLEVEDEVPLCVTETPVNPNSVVRLCEADDIYYFGALAAEAQFHTYIGHTDRAGTLGDAFCAVDSGANVTASTDTDPEARPFVIPANYPLTPSRYRSVCCRTRFDHCCAANDIADQYLFNSGCFDSFWRHCTRRLYGLSVAAVVYVSRGGGRSVSQLTRVGPDGGPIPEPVPPTGIDSTIVFPTVLDATLPQPQYVLSNLTLENNGQGAGLPPDTVYKYSAELQLTPRIAAAAPLEMAWHFLNYTDAAGELCLVTTMADVQRGLDCGRDTAHVFTIDQLPTRMFCLGAIPMPQADICRSQYQRNCDGTFEDGVCDPSAAGRCEPPTLDHACQFCEALAYSGFLSRAYPDVSLATLGCSITIYQGRVINSATRRIGTAACPLISHPFVT